MRRGLILFAAAASLVGCATVPASDVATDGGAFARADASFDRLRPVVEAMLPLLPPERQLLARGILTAIGAGLDLARGAETNTQRDAAIAALNQQLAALHAALQR